MMIGDEIQRVLNAGLNSSTKEGQSLERERWKVERGAAVQTLRFCKRNSALPGCQVKSGQVWLGQVSSGRGGWCTMF